MKNIKTLGASKLMYVYLDMNEARHHRDKVTEQHVILNMTNISPLGLATREKICVVYEAKTSHEGK